MPLCKDPNFKLLAKKFSKKLKKIKVFLCDVDGVLTDGQIFWAGQEVGFNRSFNSLDGWGLKFLQKNGIKTGIISGGNSLSLHKRAEYLNMDYFFIGDEDKRSAYLKVLADGYKDENILFMGDDFIDLPLLKRAGFSATVPEASPEIKALVDYTTYRSMGDACVREVIDLLRIAQGLFPHIPDFED